MNDSRTAYADLLSRSREIGLLGSCSALLEWDEQTGMPTGGTEHRAAILGLLAGLRHDRATNPAIGELLTSIETSDLVADPASAEAANVRELRRGYDRRVKLPKSLVEEIARVTSTAQHEWIAARKAVDFGRFRPWLERVVALKRDEAACLSSTSADQYDALLDEYEPGTSSAAIRRLFDGLRGPLVELTNAITTSPKRVKVSRLEGDYPIDRQKILGELVAAAIGFDFERGRLDVSAHPFCTGIGPGDCRITTRYRTSGFEESFFGVLHEVGHALYEQGLDPAHSGTPMGEAASLGVHESQSRLWENAIGRSRPFWKHWLPITRRMFPAALGTLSADDYLLAVNRVEPSLIRTEADEVTYNLHILIRFDLEHALIAGDLRVADLPSAWDAAYRANLDIVAPTVADGCLQDVHWSAGLFGYFPTYTLGNLYAAQLMTAARRDLGDLDLAIERGETSSLLDWLRLRIHSHGQRYRPVDLVEHATGSKIDPELLVRSLRIKYEDLYGL